MPSDDYAPIGGGGALRIKGAKVNKKKKKRDRTDLEKNLEAGDGAVVKKTKKSPEPDDKKDEEEEDDTVPAVKTESERRHEEIKKQRLLKMADASSARPGLLKTHKERVEELNTYLSKLSEHHDMPKIGPG